MRQAAVRHPSQGVLSGLWPQLCFSKLFNVVGFRIGEMKSIRECILSLVFVIIIKQVLRKFSDTVWLGHLVLVSEQVQDIMQDKMSSAILRI